MRRADEISRFSIFSNILVPALKAAC